MPALTVDLVGSHFRPPAGVILSNLPAGTSLLLQPDPANLYDTKAIKVLADLSRTELSPDQLAQLNQMVDEAGYDLRDLIASGLFHLGFIGDSDGKVCRETDRPGNREVGRLLAAIHPDDWTDCLPIPAGVLAFDPKGKPLVKIGA